MYCKVCGNILKEGERLCTRCGAQVLNNQQNSNVVNNEFNNMHQNFESNTNILEQNNSSINILSNNQTTTKKKKKWWVLPIITFFIPIGIMILKTALEMMLNLNGDKGSEIYPLLRLIIYGFLPIIQMICWIGLIPSIVFAAIMSRNPQTDYYEEMINNIIDSNQSLDEKMLITYIGTNYDRITTRKFSIPAMFLNFMYLLYRKMYIPTIIGIIAVRILVLIIETIYTIPETIYTIIGFSFCVVLGLNFNKWYVVYSKKQVDKIKTNNQNADEMQLINICKKKGGTNIGYAILICVVFMLIGFIFPQQKKDVNIEIFGLNFSVPSNFRKEDEKMAYFVYEVEYDASTYQYCNIKLSAQNNASTIEATSGLHSPNSSYLYKDYSSIETKKINSNTWYYQTKKSNTYDSYFYSTKQDNVHYLIEFKVGNDNTQCHEDYKKIISSLKFK